LGNCCHGEKSNSAPLEAEYDAALAGIEQEPRPGSPEAGRFDLLASSIKRYEEKHWSLRPEKRPIKNR
jgi:HTH-type transcriptional regulator/antitoxin HigA